MKKTVLILKKAAIVMMVLSIALGMNLPGVENASAATKGYYFTYAKKSVTMGSDATSFINAAGKPSKKKAEKSCAYDGKDITRKYKNFILYTYTNSNSSSATEYVDGITFLTKKVSTKEGIKIGSSEDDVIEAYGSAKAKYGVYTYTKGKTKLQISVEDGVVTQIRYVLK